MTQNEHQPRRQTLANAESPREILAHVWEDFEDDPVGTAKAVLEQGGWASGVHLDEHERQALETLARGAQTNNTTVYLYTEDRGEYLSTERATCEHCGAEGWLGDFPWQGGVVADERGDLTCDACAALARGDA